MSERIRGKEVQVTFQDENVTYGGIDKSTRDFWEREVHARNLREAGYTVISPQDRGTMAEALEHAQEELTALQLAEAILAVRRQVKAEAVQIKGANRKGRHPRGKLTRQLIRFIKGE